MPSTSRRAFLGAVATGTVASIAGCSSSCPDDALPDPPHTVDSADAGSGFETVPGGSWPSPRFDPANTGAAPVRTDSATPSVQWRTSLPTSSTGDDTAAASPVVVADETVVATSSAGVVALSLRDGTRQWTRALTPATVPSAVGIGEGLAPPVVADGRVFLGTADGVLGLDIADGSVVWRHTDPVGAGVPAVTDDALFVPTTDGVVRFDTASGAREWTAPVDGTRLAVADGTVVVTGEKTVALAAATGEERWRRDDRATGYPVVADGTAYLTTTYGDLLGRSLPDGTEQWRIDRGRAMESAVVTSDSVYAIERPGESSSATFAFDRTDDGPPEPRWCSEIDIGGAVTAAAGDAVVTSQREVGLTAFTRRFGEATWQYPVDYRAVSLAVLDGGLVSVSPAGTVVALGGERPA
ncbi:outer membrane protein assembly factor BamB family protein [Haloarcula brevis]|uniref:outer membrane protein assembly factor BamB family protein n=1 Tax=Haloarcula brevis TaxID=3111453 RepID=UPI00300EE799